MLFRSQARGEFGELGEGVEGVGDGVAGLSGAGTGCCGEKLARKGADLVVSNQMGEGRAFGTDDNEAVLVTAAGTRALPLMSKDALADEVLSAALGLRGNQSA